MDKKDINWATEVERVESEKIALSEHYMPEDSENKIEDLNKEESNSSSVLKDSKLTPDNDHQLDQSLIKLNEKLHRFLIKFNILDEELASFQGRAKTEKIQNLMSSTIAKKNIFDIYIKVMENMLQNILPLIHKYDDDEELFKATASPLFEIVEEIEKEILDAENIFKSIECDDELNFFLIKE
jgi:hypothetical protein